MDKNKKCDCKDCECGDDCNCNDNCQCCQCHAK